MFPRGIPSAALHSKVTSARRRQIPRQPDSWLVITRILRPQHAPGQTGSGSRLPTVPLPLHRRPPRRHRPPQRCSAPRLRHRAPPASNSFFFSRLSFALHHHRRASHHASSPPRFPSRCVRNSASMKVKDVVGVFRSRCRLRALWRQAFPRHSRRFRTPKVVCAAWSFLRERLTPRPTTAKSHYRLFFKQTLLDYEKSNFSAAKQQ